MSIFQKLGQVLHQPNSGLSGGLTIPGIQQKPTSPPNQRKNPYNVYSNSPPSSSSSVPNHPHQTQRNSYDDRYNPQSNSPPRPPSPSYDSKRSHNPFEDGPGSYNEKQNRLLSNQRTDPSVYDSPPSYDNSINSPSLSRGPQLSPQTREYQNDSSPDIDDFIPFALPQTQKGDGQPFLRAYTPELASYGISENAFLHFLDDLNVAIRPNPETQLLIKAASMADWFIPGVGASAGLMIGGIVMGAGAAMGKKSMTGKCLANANIAIFIPKGLEVVTCNTSDVSNAAGYDPFLQNAGGWGMSNMNGGFGQQNGNGFGMGQMANGFGFGQQNGNGLGQQYGNGFGSGRSGRSGGGRRRDRGLGGMITGGGMGAGGMMGGSQGMPPMDPLSMIGAYGDHLAQPVQSGLPLINRGRQDPIAAVANRMSNREATRNTNRQMKKADRNASRGRLSSQNSSGPNVKWVLIRPASSESLRIWRETLAAIDESERQAAAEGRPLA